MDEVPNFVGLEPSQRIISSDSISVDGSDISLSNQQFVLLSGWVNDS